MVQRVRGHMAATSLSALNEPRGRGGVNTPSRDGMEQGAQSMGRGVCPVQRQRLAHPGPGGSSYHRMFKVGRVSS